MKIQELNKRNFKDFGEILEPEEKNLVRESNFNYYSTDIINTVKGIEGGFLEVTKKVNMVKVFERHNYSEEVIIPLKGTALLYLAEENERALIKKDIKAFKISQGIGVRLGVGVWHAIPALIKPNDKFLCLIIKNRNSEEDVSFTSLYE